MNELDPMFSQKAAKPVSEIKRKTKKTSLLTLACMVTGLFLSIPAFTNVKKQLPQTVFCFRPPVTYTFKNELIWDAKAKKRFVKKTKIEQETSKKYCTGDKIRVGLASDVQDEREENAQFGTKISILKQIPASSSWLPYVALLGGVTMLVAYVVYTGHTEELVDNLNLIYHYERIKALMTQTDALADEEIIQTAVTAKVVLAKDGIQRDAASQLDSNKAPEEKETGRKMYDLNQKLIEKEFGLNIQTLDEKITKSEAAQAKYGKLRDKYQKPETVVVEGASEKQITKALKEVLKKSENKWISEVMESVNSVLVYGKAGSGKSFTTASIIYLRNILEGSTLRCIADFDMDDNMSQGEALELSEMAWDGLKEFNPILKGRKDNGVEYAEAITDLMELCNDETRSLKSKDEVIYLWDEVSRMKTLVDEELAKKWAPFVATKCRKKRVKNFVVAHGKNQQHLGGVEGFADTVKDEFITIRLVSNNKQPMMRGFISNLYSDAGERIDDQLILVPSWLNISDLKRIKNGDLSPLNKEDESDDLEGELEDDDLEADLWAAFPEESKTKAKSK